VLPFGETRPRIILDTPYRKPWFRFSPDGHWVAYASDETLRFEISVASFPSFAEKRQVSSNGGVFPAWRKDGKEVFFQSPDGTLMSAEIKTGSESKPAFPAPVQVVAGRDLVCGGGEANGSWLRILYRNKRKSGTPWF
jgi:hypothetical protein